MFVMTLAVLTALPAASTPRAPTPTPQVASLEQQCAAADKTGCAVLAEMVAEGRGGAPKDLVRAAALRDKACKLEDANACLRLGQALAQGDGIDKDVPAAQRAWKEAARLYGAACDRAELSGCSGLGWMYMLNMVPEHAREEAAKLFQRACDGNDADGCSGLAAAYLDGAGVGWSKRKAMDLYDRARTLFRQACESGDPRACWRLEKLTAEDE